MAQDRLQLHSARGRPWPLFFLQRGSTAGSGARSGPGPAGSAWDGLISSRLVKVMVMRENLVAARSNRSPAEGAHKRLCSYSSFLSDREQRSPAVFFRALFPQRFRTFLRSFLSVTPFVSPFSERERERERLRPMLQVTFWLDARSATHCSPDPVTRHDGSAAIKAARSQRHLDVPRATKIVSAARAPYFREEPGVDNIGACPASLRQGQREDICSGAVGASGGGMVREPTSRSSSPGSRRARVRAQYLGASSRYRSRGH